jgi:hypothetical protein
VRIIVEDVPIEIAVYGRKLDENGKSAFHHIPLVVGQDSARDGQMKALPAFRLERDRITTVDNQGGLFPGVGMAMIRFAAEIGWKGFRIEETRGLKWDHTCQLIAFALNKCHLMYFTQDHGRDPSGRLADWSAGQTENCPSPRAFNKKRPSYLRLV